jgi:hypothetical protein
MPGRLPIAFQWAFVMTNALVDLLGKDHLQVRALAVSIHPIVTSDP